MRVMATDLKFPEGPVAQPDGSVLLVEIGRGTLTRVTNSGEVEVVAQCGGGPTGAAMGPDGHVYICNNGGAFEWHGLEKFRIGSGIPAGWTGGSIQRVDLASGRVEILYAECDGRPLRSPNDLVFDASGGFWFTDTGVRTRRLADRTGVFYARADGSSIAEVIFPLDSPNGVGLSPAGDRIYVSETWTGRLWWWPVERPGEVGRPNALIEHGGNLLLGLPGLQGFDSIAVDGEGWPCVGTLIEGAITAVSPDGMRVQQLILPDPLVTNLCFGGPDLRTAFITLGGTGQLLAVRWPRPGARLQYQQLPPA
ncbi:MAG TPA: gluconolaconase [Chloroflexi bacterium]|nr:gluconolaconase [Chloroflexota bacterium]